MNQSELIAKVAEISGESRKAVEAVLKITGDVVAAELQEGGEVVLPGIGKLLVQHKPAHTGKNPKTGEALKIAATTVPTFKAGAGFKAAVAPKKKAKK